MGRVRGRARVGWGRARFRVGWGREGKGRRGMGK